MSTIDDDADFCSLADMSIGFDDKYYNASSARQDQPLHEK
jgi:hypothetical protein